MARSAHQKEKLLYLYQMLLEQSDEEHPIPLSRIIEGLERQGITAERKGIYGDMEALRSFGLDVQYRKGKTGGWFVAERHFELAELKLLVDAVQSCKFITRRKSNALIRKLESLASTYQAHQLQRQVYVSGRVKTMNERVYYSIDKLQAAIAQGKAVSFRYFDYNVQKQKVYHRAGERYAVSPYGLIWDNENYYLAGYDHHKGQMRHYRVDKMVELQVMKTLRQGDTSCTRFDLAAYTQKHFGMFGGREGWITLRCRNQLVGVVLDRFGQEVILVPSGDEHFTVMVQAVVSPQFLGWVFGLGDGVQIQSPDWAEAALRQQLEQVGRLYFGREEENGQAATGATQT